MTRRPRRTLTIVTAPAAEPVTLTEAKAWAKIDDTTDDDLVTALITAARMSAEEYLRRTLISTTYKLTLDLADCPLSDLLGDGVYDLPVSILYDGLPSAVELPKGPVSSISSVVTYDTSDASSTFDTANYRIDTAGERLVLTYGTIWPTNLRSIAACEITYVAGYGSTATGVPQPIRTGIKMHIQAMYDGRGQCETDMPPGCKQLYNQYRIMGDRLG